MAVLIEVDVLRRSRVLRDLAPAELEQLASVMRRRRYRRGEVVFHQGDPGDTLHVILQGRVKVVLDTEDGAEAVLFVFGPGDLFGEVALLDGGARSATVTALEPLQTATLRRSAFLALLRRDPAALEAVLVALARTIRRTTDELADLVGLDIDDRLAKKLLELARTHGHPVDGGIQIDLRLTQEELGAMVDTTRATVNKLLGMYEDRGDIVRRGHTIVVRWPEALEPPELSGG
jgi:CRP/FNR family transcriptional regulator/CRP/FNR family cyclic AMP-dependent transcriptional regulator